MAGYTPVTIQSNLGLVLYRMVRHSNGDLSLLTYIPGSAQWRVYGKRSGTWSQIVSWTTTTVGTGSGGGARADMAVLSDGNILLVSNGSVNTNIRYAIIQPDGTENTAWTNGPAKSTDATFADISLARNATGGLLQCSYNDEVKVKGTGYNVSMRASYTIGIGWGGTSVQESPSLNFDQLQAGVKYNNSGYHAAVSTVDDMWSGAQSAGGGTWVQQATMNPASNFGQALATDASSSDIWYSIHSTGATYVTSSPTTGATNLSLQAPGNFTNITFGRTFAMCSRNGRYYLAGIKAGTPTVFRIWSSDNITTGWTQEYEYTLSSDTINYSSVVLLPATYQGHGWADDHVPYVFHDVSNGNTYEGLFEYSTGTTYDETATLAISRAQTAARTAAFGAALTMNRSVDAANAKQMTLYDDLVATISRALDQTGAQTANTSTALARALAILAQGDSTQIVEATAALARTLAVTDQASASIQALTSVARALGMAEDAAQAAAVDVALALSRGIVLTSQQALLSLVTMTLAASIDQTGNIVAERALDLAAGLALDAAGGALADGALALARALALDEDAARAAAASFTLSIARAETLTGVQSLLALMSLAAARASDHTATVDRQAVQALARALTLDTTGGALADGALDLAHALGLTGEAAAAAAGQLQLAAAFSDQFTTQQALLVIAALAAGRAVAQTATADRQASLSIVGSLDLDTAGGVDLLELVQFASLIGIDTDSLIAQVAEAALALALSTEQQANFAGQAVLALALLAAYESTGTIDAISAAALARVISLTGQAAGDFTALVDMGAAREIATDSNVATAAGLVLALARAATQTATRDTAADASMGVILAALLDAGASVQAATALAAFLADTAATQQDLFTGLALDAARAFLSDGFTGDLTEIVLGKALGTAQTGEATAQAALLLALALVIDQTATAEIGADTSLTRALGLTAAEAGQSFLAEMTLLVARDFGAEALVEILAAAALASGRALDAETVTAAAGQLQLAAARGATLTGIAQAEGQAALDLVLQLVADFVQGIEGQVTLARSAVASASAFLSASVAFSALMQRGLDAGASAAVISLLALLRAQGSAQTGIAEAFGFTAMGRAGFVESAAGREILAQLGLTAYRTITSDGLQFVYYATAAGRVLIVDFEDRVLVVDFEDRSVTVNNPIN